MISEEPTKEKADAEEETVQGHGIDWPIAFVVIFTCSTFFLIGYICAMWHMEKTEQISPVRIPSVCGHVRNAAGGPVGGARVSIRGKCTHTDPSGYFELCIPEAPPSPSSPSIRIDAVGFESWTSKVLPGSNDLVAILRAEEEKEAKGSDPESED